MRGQIQTRTAPEQDVTVLTNSTQYLKVETLRNIHAIHLHCTVAGAGATVAQILTDIASVRLYIGGKLIVDLTPTEIFMIYHFYHDRYGVSVPVGDLPLYFLPPEMAWTGQAKYFRLGCKANADPESTMANSIRIEIAWINVGLTVTRCQPFLETDDDEPEPIGDHIRWLRYNTTWPAASRQDITDLDRQPNALFARSYIFDLTTGVISHFDVIENDAFRLRDVPIDVVRQQCRKAGRVPQATHEVLPLNLGNDTSSVTPIGALTKFVVSPLWSTLPGGHTVLQELVYRGL